MSEFVKRVFTWLLFAGVFGGLYYHSMQASLGLLLLIFGVILLVEWPRLMLAEGYKAALLTFAYPVTSMVLMVVLHRLFYRSDVVLTLYPLIIAWTADTAGYVVGKILGTHKIYPALSPGKSWEGFFGAVGSIFALNIFLLPKINASFASVLSAHFIINMLASFLLAAASLVGGFWLSFLKRRKGLKDAGNWLPGHGGFLDRFDSVFVVVVIIWLMIIFIK